MPLRPLKDETAPAAGGIEQSDRISTEKRVETTGGGTAVVDKDRIDLSSFDNFKPYIEGQPLPKPVVATNRRGQRFIKKIAEPRFYFAGDVQHPNGQVSNDLIKVVLGANGKKRSLFWIYKHHKGKDLAPNVLHRQIRAHLRAKGIPGA